VSFRSPEEAGPLLVTIGRLLYEKSLVASTEGNLSIRLGDDRFLLTPAGAPKGRLRPECLVTVDGSGRLRAGQGAPSSETAMHLAIYRARPDVGAIVHAHPPTATGFAVAGIPLADCVLPEILLTVGSIPLAPYGTPGGEELAETIVPIARAHDAFLLKNHGAVTLGEEIWQAFHRMEMIESFARTLFTARLLGRVEPLERTEVAKLLGMRPAPPARAEGCGGCKTCTEKPAEGSPGEDLLVEEVLRRLEERLREAPDRK